MTATIKKDKMPPAITTLVDLLDKRSRKGSETTARTPMAGNDRQRSYTANTIKLQRQNNSK